MQFLPDPPQSFIQHCPSPVTEGDNVRLYCNATGNPLPQTAWIKSGKVLVTDSVYVIRAINRSQAGMESEGIILLIVPLMFNVS